MPTGYTADVQTGKVTDFAEFALQCARAFGALITMRDLPADAPIPTQFKPDKYHEREAQKATAERDRLLSLSPTEIADEAALAEAKRISEEQKWNRASAREKARYEAMIAKVNEWVPPSPDHVEMKKFMLEQLQSSINFDCREREIAPAVTATEWYASRVDAAKRNIEYHREEIKKEIQRSEERTRWVKALKESLS